MIEEIRQKKKENNKKQNKNNEKRLDRLQGFFQSFYHFHNKNTNFF